jgi:cell division protein FtsB
MSDKIKKLNFWVRRRSHLAVIAIGSLVIALLFLNEDASWEHNMEYQEQIKALNEEIKTCNDSAEYYRVQRQQLLTGTEELEQLAREEYRMQKATEDVFIIKHAK